MKLSYTEIFKYSDLLNPVSAAALFSAGRVAKLGPKKMILDLGSGKGFPSLLWASTFGVRVEGCDINEEFVEYANSRAKMLNLSRRVKYSCQDIKKVELKRKYDVIAFLGLGTAHMYGGTSEALRFFKTTLRDDGVLFLAEPVWLKKPVPSEVVKALDEAEESLRTESEMQQLMKECGFRVLRRFVSSKEDWQLYVRPVYVSMREIIEKKRKLAGEAQEIIDGFKAECDAVGKYWNMLLWVAKAH
jgi:cyclopropane fatty-acyl-phospholipid synthase-like methyltransferase